MDWQKVLSTSVNQLTAETINSVIVNLPLVDPNALNNDELRNFFTFTCQLINRFSVRIFFNCLKTVFNYSWFISEKSVSQMV